MDAATVYHSSQYRRVGSKARSDYRLTATCSKQKVRGQASARASTHGELPSRQVWGEPTRWCVPNIADEEFVAEGRRELLFISNIRHTPTGGLTPHPD
eukprot:9489939-Pyramimonas_sp.AAC.4